MSQCRQCQCISLLACPSVNELLLLHFNKGVAYLVGLALSTSLKRIKSICTVSAIVAHKCDVGQRRQRTVFAIELQAVPMSDEKDQYNLGMSLEPA